MERVRWSPFVEHEALSDVEQVRSKAKHKDEVETHYSNIVHHLCSEEKNVSKLLEDVGIEGVVDILETARKYGDSKILAACVYLRYATSRRQIYLTTSSLSKSPLFKSELIRISSEDKIVQTKATYIQEIIDSLRKENWKPAHKKEILKDSTINGACLSVLRDLTAGD